MAKTDLRRQKKLAKHKAKRNEKRRKIALTANRGVSERMRSLAGAPILDCRITSRGEDQGMISLLIARQRGETVGFALFLIDTYCLGIKDAMGSVGTMTDFQSFLENLTQRQPTRPIDPPSARKLVEDAVAFAESMGLSPHVDFSRFHAIFGDIDSQKAEETFEMGQGGRPLFIQGPHDSPEFCRRVMETISANLGVVERKSMVEFDDPAEFIRYATTFRETMNDDDRSL